MTNEEAKAHFQKLAQDAGLSKEQTETVLQAMENEKFRTGVSAGYKRHEDYSREMDQMRTEKQRLRDWYEKEELPKYQSYQQGLDKLAKYREVYGDIDEDQGLNIPQANGNGNRRSAAGMTKEEVDRYIEDKLRLRDGAYVGLTKTAMKISADYMKRFNDLLDVDAVEKIALDKGLPLDQAYKEFIAPKEQAAMEARHKEEIEKAKAEAVRDYQSRMHLPVDTKPRDAHPFFDRKTVEPGKTDQDQDRSSREEFMKGWNDYAAEVTKTAE